MANVVVFDLDGVITSERAYWMTGGLVLHELLYSPLYWNLSGAACHEPLRDPEQIRRVSNETLPIDFIVKLKALALNSNWDTCYVGVCLCLLDLLATLPDCAMLLPLRPWDVDWIARLRQQLARHHITTLGAGVFARLDEPAFRGASGLGLLERFDAYASELPGMLPIAGVFGRSSRFWQFCTDLFQQWYLGDELYEQVSGHPPAQPGKIGCIHLEEPLLPLEHLRATLEQLCRQGYTLGVATGRPGREATMPLKQYGLYDYFDQQRIVTHKEVELAEAELRRRGDSTLLIKPHPYQFLRAADPTYVPGDPLPARGSFVVVGDSTSDVLGARAANALMLAVYTGALTAEARDLLEQSQPDHLLADVTQVPDLLAWLGKKAEVMGTDEQCK